MSKMGDQVLSSKEQSLFKNMMKFHNIRQYKKALKNAENILKKNPIHGETLSMKGLILFDQGKKDEAFEFVKEGLKHNMMSKTCWQLYGLVYKGNREYEQAAKCFTQSLKLDPKDNNVHRDLTLCYIRLRKYEEFNSYCREVVTRQPTFQRSWMALAVSFFLLGEYPMAAKVMDQYESTLDITGEQKGDKVEKSERLMFKNHILSLQGDLEESLRDLYKIEDSVRDKESWKEKECQYLLGCNKLEQAEKGYKELLERNPMKLDYYIGLISAGGVGKASDILVDYKQNIVALRLLLNHTEGSEFKANLDLYLKTALEKGSPALFYDLQSLYSTKSKKELIVSLVSEYQDSMEKVLKDQDPSTFVWLRILFAIHELHCGHSESALSHLIKATKHTPTSIDVYLVLGKLLKRSGDLEGSYKAYEYARRLDLADRYVNTKTAEALLRLGRVEEAETVFKLFTKDDELKTNSIVDLQVVWFQLRAGKAYLQKGERGKALQMFKRTEKLFLDWRDDEMDYHMYCCRKATLRSYLNLLEFEDGLLSSGRYMEVVCGLSDAYISLLENPPSASNANDLESQFAHLPPAERKKMISKMRKKQKRDAQKTIQQKDKKDDDKKEEFVPEELEKVTDPLEKAFDIVRPVCVDGSNSIMFWSTIFDLYLRKKKLLPCLRALIRLKSIEETSPQLTVRLAQFVLATNAKDVTAILPVLESAFSELMDIESLKIANWKTAVSDWVDRYMKSHISSLSRTVSGSKAKLLLNPKESYESISSRIMQGFETFTDRTHANCVTAHHFFQSFKQPGHIVEDWHKLCARVFPLSNVFGSGEKLDQIEWLK